jgi:hypothetical protein
MAKYFTESYQGGDSTGAPLYLYLSIHEIRSYRIGPALWTYNDGGHSNIYHLQLMTSHTNTSGIAFGVDHKTHMKLFDVSTEADYPLIEVGKLNYNQHLDHIGLLYLFMQWP